ncbi:MAG: InlB B-repeat-containing protein, partial [Candidatus Methanomethylophilaceae archaeon]
MNTKIVAIAAVAVVLVVVVAGVAIVMTGDDDGNFTGVIYDGNGGKTNDGSSTWKLTSTTVDRNPFHYDGHEFVNWNTEADGSGTSYNVGNIISYPDHGNVRLYAQWTTDVTKRITSYSPSYSVAKGDSALKDGIALYIGDTKLSMATAYFAPLSENTIITISYIEGCTDWAFDETNGYFTFNYNGHGYTLKISVTNSEN